MQTLQKLLPLEEYSQKRVACGTALWFRSRFFVLPKHLCLLEKPRGRAGAWAGADAATSEVAALRGETDRAAVSARPGVCACRCAVGATLGPASW